jgi:thioredoxin 1
MMPVERPGVQRYGCDMQYVRTGYVLSLCLLLGGMGLTVQAALPDIYPPAAQATADLDNAIKKAGREHKRVIVDFGGNWCTDCRVLDLYFHDAANRPVLEANYVLVHVNIEHMDANVPITERYRIPLSKGVPAIAVLDEQGQLLFSQKAGEFEAMRHMQSAAVTDFLLHWKAGAS